MTVNVPEPYRSVIDLVTERDRQFFEAHPDATAYSRPFVDGEAWPALPVKPSRVVVTQIRPGVRSRTFSSL